MPKVNSVITEKIENSKNKNDIKHYVNLKNKKGISKMLITYNLAYLESSYNRQLDFKNDILLFFDIVLSLPTDSQVTMFYFYDDKIIMDFDGKIDLLETFCNNLIKTGQFKEVYSKNDGEMIQIITKK